MGQARMDRICLFMDDSGVPPILGNLHIYIYMYYIYITK